MASDFYQHERPDDFTPYDRCITRGVLGSMFPNIYNTGTEILQAPGLVLSDANTLRSEVTVTDPGTWTRPWTVRFPLVRDSGYAMYEYACHEGTTRWPIC